MSAALLFLTPLAFLMSTLRNAACWSTASRSASG